MKWEEILPPCDLNLRAQEGYRVRCHIFIMNPHQKNKIDVSVRMIQCLGVYDYPDNRSEAF